MAEGVIRYENRKRRSSRSIGRGYVCITGEQVRSQVPRSRQMQITVSAKEETVYVNTEADGTIKKDYRVRMA